MKNWRDKQYLEEFQTKNLERDVRTVDRVQAFHFVQKRLKRTVLFHTIERTTRKEGCEIYNYLNCVVQQRLKVDVFWIM